MHIVINRTKENFQEIEKLKKNISLKVPQRKIFLCVILGLAFYIYSGDAINFSTFSGYALIAMLFWGGAAMLYLEKFYPKPNISPIDTIEEYKRNEEKFNFKIEMTDNCLCFDTDRIYVKMDWSSFKRFKLSKNYIFLFIRRANVVPFFVIKLAELKEKDYNELCDLLKERISDKVVNPIA
jgi:hypothetical protein